MRVSKIFFNDSQYPYHLYIITYYFVYASQCSHGGEWRLQEVVTYMLHAMDETMTV